MSLIDQQAIGPSSTTNRLWYGVTKRSKRREAQTLADHLVDHLRQMYGPLDNYLSRQLMARLGDGSCENTEATYDR